MKSKRQLESFVKYCHKHPELRFWQALRNWSSADFIYWHKFDRKTGENIERDTFYWERRSI